jgi:hypothetical protein
MDRNFLYSKKHFWFGSDPVDTKAVPSFKADKAVDVAHHVAAWAAETGKGLLFFSEKSDKTAPHGAIQLVRHTLPHQTVLAWNTDGMIFSRPRQLSQLSRAPTSSTSPPRATSTPSRLAAPPSVTTGSAS